MSHAAFLKTIGESPDDDTARLVFADWLDEQGTPADADRAEFIRLQVRLAALDETDPDRPALEDRENELLRRYERAWVGRLSAPLARGLNRWRFERGFVGAVQLGARTLNAHGGPLFKAHPLSKVRLSALDGERESTVEALARRGWWPRVRDLDTGDTTASAAQFEPLLTSPHLTGLRRLAFTASDRHEPLRLPAVLGRCPSLPGLEALHVRDWRNDPAELLPALDAAPGLRVLRLVYAEFTATGLKRLLASAFAARGPRLELENGNLGAWLWPALRARKARPVLARLNLSGAGRSADLDLPTLLSAPAAANLDELDVSETGLSGQQVRALARTDFMARARELCLTRCHVAPRVMAALARASAPHLRKLTLGETGLLNEGVYALCQAEWADNLTHLDLMRNGLGDDALVAMATSGRFVNLRRLDLRVNSPDLGDGTAVQIGDRGAEALAAAPNFARLRHLNLYRTRITARGVEALLNSPHCRLSEMELGGYDLGPDLPRVLARSPGTARLTKLALSFTPALGGDALLPLAESPHLSPLCVLDLRYNNTSDRVCARLAERLGRRLENYPGVTSW